MGVTHGYGDVTLFEDVSFDLRRRDRVAILGANGAGKSTLLRVVSGKEDAREGDASFGSANVRMQYFAQNQADAMDLTKTVMRTIEDASAERPVPRRTNQPLGHPCEGDARGCPKALRRYCSR